MPKPLSEYGIADWLRVRPLLHRLKTRRYRRIDARYGLLPAGDEIAEIVGRLRGQKVLVTIAYGDAEAVGWQVVLMRRYLPDVLHVVADNTPAANPQKADIEATARRLGVACFVLPPNPWHEGSRSHGIAMNWVWRNVLLPGRPQAFGFLDDDIFPTARDDPFASLATQDFYGVVRTAGTRWFLWAGFCTFRFAAVKDMPLDFGQDWFAGLDTGGGNWQVLYRHVSRAGFNAAPSRLMPFRRGVSVVGGPLQWVGSWLHEVGATGDPALGTDKRREVRRLLAPHLAAAGFSVMPAPGERTGLPPPIPG